MHLLAVQCLLTHGTIVTEPLPVWFYNLSCGVVNHQHCNKPSDHPGLITSELVGGPLAFKSSEGDQCKVTSVLCILSPQYIFTIKLARPNAMMHSVQQI